MKYFIGAKWSGYEVVRSQDWRMMEEAGGLIELKIAHVPEGYVYASEVLEGIAAVVMEHLLNKKQNNLSMIYFSYMQQPSMMRGVGIATSLPKHPP